jgi:hypothetical protein
MYADETNICQNCGINMWSAASVQKLDMCSSVSLHARLWVSHALSFVLFSCLVKPTVPPHVTRARLEGTSGSVSNPLWSLLVYLRSFVLTVAPFLSLCGPLQETGTTTSNGQYTGADSEASCGYCLAGQTSLAGGDCGDCGTGQRCTLPGRPARDALNWCSSLFLSRSCSLCRLLCGVR